ncbi:MAG: polyphenol oxidase family protein, partial [Lachnospiraceae bacterium]|nr:polyphenol oxidase family protein [Lachnospiraceae bacterium]
VHAGWRGSVGRIAEKAVEQMSGEFGSEPSDLRVVIGPSIGTECYEVGRDVADAFFEAFGEDAKSILTLSGAQGAAQGCEKYRLDLWEANRLVLRQAGVKPEHIVVSGLCTMCRQDLFFSHRASGTKRGSMAGFIMLR